jgi:N6-adenosine-specific RNA methylase IME4/ParB-like chromosome segregation protein Spo0J
MAVIKEGKASAVATTEGLEVQNQRVEPASTSPPIVGVQARVPISYITIGDRHRKDLGDIDGLAASIADIGMLQPIVVTPDGRLIAGARRLRAAQALGWRDIPIKAVDLTDIVKGEYAENAIRKDFTLSEAVAIKRALEPAEREAAKARMLAGKPSENFSGGRTLDKVAKVAGLHRTTLAKAEAVVEAAEAEPQKYGKLVEQMDLTGRANGCYRRLQVARQAEAIRAEPPPYPKHGPYRVGTADVPWPYDPADDDPYDRATHPYPQMSLAQIYAEGAKVSAIMHPDAALWFWSTNFHMPYAYEALKTWGFAPRTILTWVKDKAGTGKLLRGQSEQCILAVRGNPIIQLSDQSTVLFAPRGANSEKPAAFYELVESLCRAPRYMSLFHRGPTGPLWDGHGDEYVERAPEPEAAAPAAETPPAEPTDDDAIPAFLDRRATQ